VFDRYVTALTRPGVEFMPEAPTGRASRWLTCLTIDPEVTGTTPAAVREHLEARDIEARPTWKPMHQQPVFAGCAARLDGTSDRIFATGLCLPSGSSLTHADQDRVVEAVLEALEGCS
jgi:pyridoxal phosphate-dependent aminotransferase EpsN